MLYWKTAKSYLFFVSAVSSVALYAFACDSLSIDSCLTLPHLLRPDAVIFHLESELIPQARGLYRQSLNVEGYGLLVNKTHEFLLCKARGTQESDSVPGGLLSIHDAIRRFYGELHFFDTSFLVQNLLHDLDELKNSNMALRDSKLEVPLENAINNANAIRFFWSELFKLQHRSQLTLNGYRLCCHLLGGFARQHRYFEEMVAACFSSRTLRDNNA